MLQRLTGDVLSRSSALVSRGVVIDIDTYQWNYGHSDRQC